MSTHVVSQARLQAVSAVPEYAVRAVCALLAIAISVVHVADQGGITVLNTPSWIGWSFRLVEVAGVLTAMTLLLPRTRWLGWAAALPLGAGPFLFYLTSRSIGLPGDPGDVGNWGYWVGTASLLVESALIIMSGTMLLAARRRTRGV